MAAINFSKKNREIDHDIELVEAIYTELLHVIDSEAVFKLSEEAILQEVEDFIHQYCATHAIHISSEKKKSITVDIKNDLLGFGPIDHLLADETVTEIMVNNHHNIYVERRGRLEPVSLRFRNERHLLNIARRIAHQVHRRIDVASPMVDARLPDGSRVNIVLSPIAVDGVALTIRKFFKNPLKIEELVEKNSISANIAKFLKICAVSRVNIIVTGGTGTGKTTLLNVISGMIPEDERVITIEDSAELQLSIPNLIRLEARLSNTEDKGEITIHDLLKNCLRMRPDRIIVGEVRGAESFEMLKALNTGHDGSMSTVHSNGAEECLLRLENMVSTYNAGISSATIRSQIASAIDLIVYVKRFRDGTRRVSEILDVVDQKEGNIVTNMLFRFEPKGLDSNQFIVGDYVASTVSPSFYDKILMAHHIDEMKECFGLK